MEEARDALPLSERNKHSLRLFAPRPLEPPARILEVRAQLSIYNINNLHDLLGARAEARQPAGAASTPRCVLEYATAAFASTQRAVRSTQRASVSAARVTARSHARRVVVAPLGGPLPALAETDPTHIRRSGRPSKPHPGAALSEGYG